VQFNSSRTFVRNIGSTGTGNGQLRFPMGVACDASNNVYVADSGNSRVAVFNSTGTWQRNIGTAGTGSGQMTNPYGVAVSSAGELSVSDETLNRILVYNASTGAFIREFGSFGAAAGQFNKPQMMAVDTSDRLYVADSSNNRVQKLTNTGSVIALIGVTGDISTGRAFGARAVAVTGSEVYVTASVSFSFSGTNGVKRYSMVPAGGIQVADAGSVVSSRSTINFVDGTGITVAVADDSTNLRANITTSFTPTVTQRSPATATTIAAGGTANPTANCLTGEIAIAGGWNANTTLIRVYNSYQNSATQWLISVLNQDTVSRTVTPYVICIATG